MKPLRPWERQKLQFSFSIDSPKYEPNATIGWAVMELPPERPLAQGAHVFVAQSSRTQKIAQAVSQYKQLAAKHGPSAVELSKYTERSFAASHAAAEGMSLAEHGAMVDELAAALRAEGATVQVRVI
ncbi:hypothetical protein [Pannonibacter phragmitetus]|uniref:hypothetical protein n=1 Tax=Pannonibacter phragmitetus TaxID=121719 RepID=UPI000B96FA8F|nr:hypothetical protein [Pannonibacter phragmitetus]